MSSSRTKNIPTNTATIADLDWLVRQGEAGIARQAMLVVSRSKKNIHYNACRISAKPLGVDFLNSTPGDEANAQIVARVFFQGVDFSSLRH